MALPHPWDAYSALQEELDQRTRIDSETWGLEAALNAIVDPEVPPQTVKLKRVRAAAARRERHRAHVRVLRVIEGGLSASELEFEAAATRETLEFLHSQVSTADWALLESVAEGISYATLAKVRGTTEGSLRVRVSRLRALLRRRAA